MIDVSCSWSSKGWERKGWGPSGAPDWAETIAFPQSVDHRIHGMVKVNRRLGQRPCPHS